MSSEKKVEIVETVRGEVSIKVSTFEQFLLDWIDTNKLATVLSVHSVLGRNTERVASWIRELPPGLPQIQPLISLFEKKEQESSINVRILCNYTDILLDYIIYIFKYYGLQLLKKGTRIDKDSEHNMSIATRLTRIYQIISNYIIGNPDLSNKEVRKKIGYKSKHRAIFKLSQDKTFLQSLTHKVFGPDVSEETEYSKRAEDEEERESLATRGGTRKIRQYNKHHKTYKLLK
jgi:hypothetical protein